MVITVALLVYLLSAATVLRSLQRQREAGTPSLQLPARRTATLGLLVAVTALMQGSPHFLPGIGMVLAALSSLPVAVGTILAPGGALSMVLATAAILVIVQVEEAFVFALVTAPLGLAAAWAVSQKRPIWQAIGIPGISLGSGIVLMSYLIGVPALGPGVHSLGPLFATSIYVAFGCIYASLWVGLIAKINTRILRAPGKHNG